MSTPWGGLSCFVCADRIRADGVWIQNRFSNYGGKRLHELLPHADQGGQPGRRPLQRRHRADRADPVAQVAVYAPDPVPLDDQRAVPSAPLERRQKRPQPHAHLLLRRWASNNHAQQDFEDYVQAFATIAAAAAAENLQVLSPTVRKGTGEGQEAWWLAQFLGACNEDTTYSCDEDAIALFDLVCGASNARFQRTTHAVFCARAAQLQLQGVQVGHRQQQLPRANEGRPEDGARGARGGGAHGPLGVGVGDVGRRARHLGHGNLVRFAFGYSVRAYPTDAFLFAGATGNRIHRTTSAAASATPRSTTRRGARAA